MGGRVYTERGVGEGEVGKCGGDLCGLWGVGGCGGPVWKSGGWGWQGADPLKTGKGYGVSVE